MDFPRIDAAQTKPAPGGLEQPAQPADGIVAGPGDKLDPKHGGTRRDARHLRIDHFTYRRLSDLT